MRLPGFSFRQKDLDVNRRPLCVLGVADTEVGEVSVQDVGAMTCRVHPGTDGLRGVARPHVDVFTPTAIADVIGVERIPWASVLTELVGELSRPCHLVGPDLGDAVRLARRGER